MSIEHVIIVTSILFAIAMKLGKLKQLDVLQKIMVVPNSAIARVLFLDWATEIESV